MRECVVGFDDRAPTPAELDQMRALVDRAMAEGAMGVGSALIYAPGSYARTDELVALCEVAARHGGMYISHIRSEGDRFLEAVDELIAIARRAKIPAEIYHLKAAGRANWGKLDEALRRIEAARASGLRITADIYPYTAGATGLDAAMPTWVQAGGLDAWIARLKDPATRARVVREIAEPGGDWESLYRAAGSAENVLLVAFKNDKLKPMTGKTLAEVARLRGKTARGDHRRPRHRGRQPGRHDLLPDGRGEPAQGAEAAMGERLLRRGLATPPKGSSSSRTRTPGLTAPSRGCSGITSASRRSSRWRRPSGA